MSLETPVTTREKVRVFVTGSCDGLAELREALGRHSEVEMVGWSEGARESAATLTGGHLNVVLHGTRSSGLPVIKVESTSTTSGMVLSFFSRSSAYLVSLSSSGPLTTKLMSAFRWPPPEIAATGLTLVRS